MWAITLAAASGFIAVVLGAFGAHGLKKVLSAEMLAVYQTAVQYHFVHTLALLAVGMLMLGWQKTMALQVSAVAFAVGIVLFSGSLYLLAITQIKIFGPITPMGGIAFMIGWMSLLVATVKSPAIG